MMTERETCTRMKMRENDKCIRFYMAFIINLCAWIWKCIVCTCINERIKKTASTTARE